MRLSDVFRFCSNAHGPSLDTKASAAAPAAAQRSFLLAVAPTANEVPAPEHARVCSLGLHAASQAVRKLQTCSLPVCPGAWSPHLSGVRTLVWLQLSGEQRLKLPSLLTGTRFLPALDVVAGFGSRVGAQQWEEWPSVCWMQSWLLVSSEDSEQA